MSHVCLFYKERVFAETNIEIDMGISLGFEAVL